MKQRDMKLGKEKTEEGHIKRSVFASKDKEKNSMMMIVREVA